MHTVCFRTLNNTETIHTALALRHTHSLTRQRTLLDNRKCDFSIRHEANQIEQIRVYADFLCLHCVCCCSAQNARVIFCWWIKTTNSKTIGTSEEGKNTEKYEWMNEWMGCCWFFFFLYGSSSSSSFRVFALLMSEFTFAVDVRTKVSFRLDFFFFAYFECPCMRMCVASSSSFFFFSLFGLMRL